MPGRLLLLLLLRSLRSRRYSGREQLRPARAAGAVLHGCTAAKTLLQGCCQPTVPAGGDGGGQRRRSLVGGRPCTARTEGLRTGQQLDWGRAGHPTMSSHSPRSDIVCVCSTTTLRCRSYCLTMQCNAAGRDAACVCAQASRLSSWVQLAADSSRRVPDRSGSSTHCSCPLGTHLLPIQLSDTRATSSFLLQPVDMCLCRGNKV